MFLAVVLGAACTGQIQDGRSSSSGTPGAPGGGNPTPGGKQPDPGTPGTGPIGTPSTPPATGPAANNPGPAPLRRLSTREYTNTIRDLLGVAATAARDFAVDQDAGGFAIGGPVSTSVDTARLLDAAEQVASAAAAKIATLVPCPTVPADAAGQADCAGKFITQFGRRAFRRPLTPDEVKDLQAVYTAHRDAEIGYAFPDAIRAVVAAMLTSPFFLYRAELGGAAPLKEGTLVRFNSHEMASRLSYGLWGTMPDDQLFTEADAGRLATPEQIEAQARRMLKDPKVRDAVADFHLQWLDVEGLPTAPQKDARFKEFTPDLVAAMLSETVAFSTDLFQGPQATGSLDKLLTATATTVTPALAKLYGATAAGTGAQAVNLDPAQRAGILTQASFLAMHADAGDSHPVRRGAMVLRRVLCTEVDPPLDMEVGQPKMPAPGLTTRERFAEHAMNPCATCHRLTDPIGFAFENYDAIGAYRTMDQGKPVDATGTLALASGEVKFKDAVSLVKALAQTPEARDCMATQWLRYFVRRAELPGDEASLRAARESFKRSNYDLRELLVALAKTRAFTHRTPSAGEVLP
jgi:hypothetical protein